MKINGKKFKPKSHEENRMKFEGDTLRARNNFKNNVSNNLFFLLKNRFEWMNNFLEFSCCPDGAFVTLCLFFYKKSLLQS